MDTAYGSNTTVSSLLNDATDAKPQGNVTRGDPSLLHQVTQLQQQLQELLSTRRELEAALKASADEKERMQQELEKVEQKHKSEKEEFLEVHRKEMQQMRDEFLNEWMETLSKQSPEVIEKMKTGVDNLINNGLKKDKMWEILCCASKAHKTNVNTIEELQKANMLLCDKNKELEDAMRSSAGFIGDDSRLGKRTRVADPSQQAAPAATPIADTDVWGQFEVMMNTGRQAY